MFIAIPSLWPPPLLRARWAPRCVLRSRRFRRSPQRPAAVAARHRTGRIRRTRRAAVPARVARWRKIPQKFLELILVGLKQAGFVESRRGAEGGYLLARAADSITVGEGIRSVDGPPE